MIAQMLELSLSHVVQPEQKIGQEGSLVERRSLFKRLKIARRRSWHLQHLPLPF